MLDNFSCEEVKSMLSAYFDEELSLEEKTMVENHLENCSHCGKELEYIQKVSASLKNYFRRTLEEMEGC